MYKIKSIFIVCYLLFTVCLSNAQWVVQYNPSTLNLQDVTFINRYTGWACADGGDIVKTTNGGLNWVLQYPGVSGKILTGIHAVDSQYVYCVGWWQTILKTTNGGTNWLIIRNGQQPPPPVGSFYGIYFLNRTTGWMLRNEYVLRTTNGGNTFDSTHMNYGYLRDIYFKDALTGVMCSDGAGIFKSTDGGIIWNQMIIPQTLTESPDFYKESFKSNIGWVIGRATNTPGLGPNVWRTTNFGTNWDTIGRVPYPYTHENYCVFFSSVNTGWCGGSYGHIFKTTNGGFNWYEQIVLSNNFRNAFWFYNDSIGWAVGGAGQILKTTNGGTYVSIENISEEIPSQFYLYQNYPNPFNSQTTIEFDIKEKNNYKFIIYNLIGQKIDILLDETLNSGKYKVGYDAGKLSSGVYFYTISSAKYKISRTFILIK
ncbi:MAG: T9SS C-terminal target domain-containing protein [Ignavibacteriae bacterium]|nr:MAG: T9SS C-terminal target domain-containing protein [Ignavibacteriota bacterium]